MDSSVISLGIILKYEISGKYIEVWTSETDKTDGRWNWCCKQGEIGKAMQGSNLEALPDILGMELICDKADDSPLFLKTPGEPVEPMLTELQKLMLSKSYYEVLPRGVKKLITLDYFQYILFNA